MANTLGPCEVPRVGGGRRELLLLLLFPPVWQQLPGPFGSLSSRPHLFLRRPVFSWILPMSTRGSHTHILPKTQCGLHFSADEGLSCTWPVFMKLFQTPFHRTSSGQTNPCCLAHMTRGSKLSPSLKSRARWGQVLDHPSTLFPLPPSSRGLRNGPSPPSLSPGDAGGAALPQSGTDLRSRARGTPWG